MNGTMNLIGCMCSFAVDPAVLVIFRWECGTDARLGAQARAHECVCTTPYWRIVCVALSMFLCTCNQVRDLFNPKAGELKIRNDPKKGFYVEKLTRNAVANVSSINKVSVLPC